MAFMEYGKSKLQTINQYQPTVQSIISELQNRFKVQSNCFRFRSTSDPSEPRTHEISMAGSSANDDALKKFMLAVESQCFEILQTGLAKRFEELDGILKSPEFDANAQFQLIRQDIVNNFSRNTDSTQNDSSSLTNTDPEDNEDDKNKEEGSDKNEANTSGDAPKKKRKLENGEAVSTDSRNVNIRPSGLIAQRVKSAMPLILGFDQIRILSEVVGNLTMMTHIYDQSETKTVEEHIRYLDEICFKGLLSALVNGINGLKNAAVNINEDLLTYHEKRAQMIYNFVQSNVNADSDSLLAVAALDFGIFLKIVYALCEIRKVYQLGLELDKIISPPGD